MILFLSIAAFFGTILFCLLLSIYAKKMKLIDIPSARKIHTHPTPVVGGIGIFISIYFLLLFIDFSYHLKILIFSTAIILTFGALDDALQLGIRIRLVLQIVTSLIVMGVGIVIVDLGGYQYFDHIISKVIFFDIRIFSLLLTLVCVVGLTNAINFVDGIDGLSSGLVLLALFFLCLFCYLDTGKTDLDFIVILIFSILGFFILNIGVFPNKKIFLGDAGSMTLGFMLAFLMIYFTQNLKYMHPVLTLWCVPLPFYDLLGVIFRRVLRKTNPFKADRRHIHHILLDKNINQNKVLVIILLISTLISSLGLISYLYLGPDFSLILFFIFFIFYFFISLKMNRKKI